MSHRKTNVIAFNVSAGTFKSFGEAVKEANAIKIWLGRLCEKKGYSCKAIIGISKHNPRVGSITTHKSGGKGRPTTIFERNSMILLPTTTEPHIHIVLYANPCDMISALLSKHLNSKYKHKICWFNNCSDYIEEAVLYVIKQSLKIRKLEYDPQGILAKDDLGFYSAVRQANINANLERIAFTYEEPQSERKIIDKIRISEAIKLIKTLQCNNNIFNIYISLCSLYKTIDTLVNNNICRVYIHLKLDRYIPP